MAKKCEETLKATVEQNKSYFETVNSIGAGINDKSSKLHIPVKYPDINDSFYSDLELDPNVLN